MAAATAVTQLPVSVANDAPLPTAVGAGETTERPVGAVQVVVVVALVPLPLPAAGDANRQTAGAAHRGPAGHRHDATGWRFEYPANCGGTGAAIVIGGY